MPLEHIGSRRRWRYVALAAGVACTALPQAPTFVTAVMRAPAPPPPWMRGAWTREWIERRGVRSNTFAVHYLQTPSVFADVRFARDRPAFAHATSFADLSDADLLHLARQRGFTGQVTAAGDTITWQHAIDFQPPDGEPDIGRVERAGPGRMYEHALDNSYVESWASTTSGDDAFLVVRVERAGRLAQLLVVVGEHFLYVQNRSADLPRATSLEALFRDTHATRADMIRYLDCEFSAGRVRGGVVPWVVEASTLPWREGRRLAFVEAIAVEAGAAQLRVRVAPTDQAVVPVNTLSRAALIALFPVDR